MEETPQEPRGRKRLSRKDQKALKKRASKKHGKSVGGAFSPATGKVQICSVPDKASKKRNNEQAATPPPRKKRRKGEARPSQSASGQSSGLSAPAAALLERLKSGSSGSSISDMLNPTHPSYDAAVKAQWKTFSKKERAAIGDFDKVRLKQAADAATVDIDHPFPVDEDDHCETGPEAYADISALLEFLCQKLGKDAASLRIYDPYYCAGAVMKHLAKIGYENVYNKCEDFYRVQREGRIPLHDVIVTNPPYSGDHVEKLLRFCHSNARPFLLLMPNYFCSKPYYEAALGGPEKAADVLYLFPERRYAYWTPRGLRAKDRVQAQHVSAAGHRTSPFVSFWYVNLSPAVPAAKLLRWWMSARKKSDPSKKAKKTAGPRLCTLQDLPKAAWA